MASGEFIRYVDQLMTVNYFKYDVVVNYFDLKFNYKNITGNSNETYTLKVNGIVDFIETREYTIFSMTKTTDQARTWIVRIPEISNNQIPAFNAGASTYNVSKIPWRQFIDRGLNYTINETSKLQTEGPISKYIGVYQTASINNINSSAGSSTFSQIMSGPARDVVLQSSPAGLAYVSTNTAYNISDFVRYAFSRYGTHPCLNLRFDPPEASSVAPISQDQQYFDVPMGVSRYKIILSNDQTGESVTAYIQGTLYNNPVYSPVQQINPQLPPPGSVATLTLLEPIPPATATVPDVTGLLPGDSRNAIEGYGFVYADGGIATIAAPGNATAGAASAQSPAGGTVAPVGSTVTVVYWP